jgi:hypothetical protein
VRRLAPKSLVADSAREPESVRLRVESVFGFDRYGVRLAALPCSTSSGITFDLGRNTHCAANCAAASPVWCEAPASCRCYHHAPTLSAPRR